jgi:hypothetical protein
MGSFYTSIHVRSETREDVLQAIRDCKLQPAYVSVRPHAGWFSIFPKSTEAQDQNLLRKLTGDLSKQLNSAALGMLVHDSDIFWYVLCEAGKVADVYDSDPGYFGGSERPPSGGDVVKLAKYCVPNTSVIELKKILLTRNDETFSGDYLAEQIGQRLGLPEEFYSNGFNYLEQEDCDGVDLVVSDDAPTKRNIFSIVPRLYEGGETVPPVEDAPAEKSEAKAGSFKVGAYLFELKEGWTGEIQKVSDGGGKKAFGLKAHKGDSSRNMVLAIQSPKKHYPTPRVEDIVHQAIRTHRFDPADFKAAPVKPILQNGIRFKIGRWEGEKEGAKMYGLFATAEVKSDECIWMAASSPFEQDMDEVEEMLNSLRRDSAD